jgi:hypothetical protein
MSLFDEHNFAEITPKPNERVSNPKRPVAPNGVPGGRHRQTDGNGKWVTTK